MIALLSSLFIKGTWLPIIVFEFVVACLSKTSEKIFVDFESVLCFRNIS